jgi:hypothetical protein
VILLQRLPLWSLLMILATHYCNTVVMSESRKRKSLTPADAEVKPLSRRDSRVIIEEETAAPSPKKNKAEINKATVDEQRAKAQQWAANSLNKSASTPEQKYIAKVKTPPAVFEEVLVESKRRKSGVKAEEVVEEPPKRRKSGVKAEEVVESPPKRRKSGVKAEEVVEEPPKRRKSGVKAEEVVEEPPKRRKSGVKAEEVVDEPPKRRKSGFAEEAPQRRKSGVKAEVAVEEPPLRRRSSITMKFPPPAPVYGK